MSHPNSFSLCKSAERVVQDLLGCYPQLKWDLQTPKLKIGIYKAVKEEVVGPTQALGYIAYIVQQKWKWAKKC